MATKKGGKTNKTAHVLNVLAGSNQEGAAETAMEADESRDTLQQRQAVRPPVLEMVRADDEALAQTIRDSLQDIENVQLDAPEAAPEPQIEEAEPAMVTAAQDKVEEGKPMAGEETKREKTMDAQPPAPESLPKPVQTSEMAVLLKLDPGQTLGYVNIMQALVEEKAQRYLDMFQVCSCARCTADVKALALTNLPAKYAVMEKSDVIPMLTVYEGRYSSQLTAQLVKACELVSRAPRHR